MYRADSASSWAKEQKEREAGEAALLLPFHRHESYGNWKILNNKIVKHNKLCLRSRSKPGTGIFESVKPIVIIEVISMLRNNWGSEFAFLGYAYIQVMFQIIWVILAGILIFKWSDFVLGFGNWAHNVTITMRLINRLIPFSSNPQCAIIGREAHNWIDQNRFKVAKFPVLMEAPEIDRTSRVHGSM